MKKRIVIINGSGGVGKDTFVEFCAEFVKVKNISSVDKVKEAAQILVGWNGEKDEKSRKFLADLKQLSIEYNNYPEKYIQLQAEKFRNSEDEKIMFIHIREASEIQKIKELLGAQTLLLTSNRVNAIKTNAADAHVAEYKYDFYLSNDGTLEELREKARQFVFMEN